MFLDENEVIMKKMKIMRIMLMVVMGILASISPVCFAAGELGNANLKGIRNLIVAAEFNGVLFEEGYADRKEEKVKELNLGEAEEKLKEDVIPITKKDIRKIYKEMESLIEKAELRVLKAKTYSKTRSTIIPTFTVRIDTMPAGEDLYFTVVHLTVSKWMSNWSGTKRIHAPVYIWSEKKMLASVPEELLLHIQSAAVELTETFLTALKEANTRKKPDEEKEEKGEKNGNNNGK
jgi:hypothetical protein